MDDVVVLTPDATVARALGAGAVVIGHDRGAAAVADLLDGVPDGQPVAVAGVARRSAGGLAPGTLVVASELCPDGVRPRPLPSATLLADDLRRDGVEVAMGPVPGDEPAARAASAVPAGSPLAVVLVPGGGAPAAPVPAPGPLRPAPERGARAAGDRRPGAAAPASFLVGLCRRLLAPLAGPRPLRPPVRAVAGPPIPPAPRASRRLATSSH